MLTSVSGRKGKDRTYENHKIAALPSAFLVSSTASSKATGSNVKLVAPIKAEIANSPPVLLGLTISVRH